MPVKNILFDLDGTLLPMDQERFAHSYTKRLAAYMAPYGYDPELLIKALWTMYKKSPKGAVSYIVIAGAFVLTAFLDVNILIVVVGCALFGLITSAYAARRDNA